ncbi:hypothetical protein ACIBCO_37225 [Streptomyces violascens]|uniref:hypothetical protein n=1 Tax=Streptomyces violascens TaxID=67381 RepID=UPI0037AAAE9C
MTFESKMTPEKRAELADLVIAGANPQEIGEEYGIRVKTLQSWVQKRKRELGIPGMPKGGDRGFSPAALLRRIEREKEGRLGAEAAAAALTQRVRMLEETLHGMQVTLEYYMGQRGPGSNPATS